MECRNFHEAASAWIDGEASAEEARMVEAHLATCASCRAAADRMRSLGPALGRVRVDVPASFGRDLFARLEKENLLPPAKSRVVLFPFRWAVVPLAAAACLALFFLAGREAVKIVRGPQQQVAMTDSGKKKDAFPSASGRVAVPDNEAGDSTGNMVGGRNIASSRLPMAGTHQGFSTEDEEIVAYLDVLEQPEVLDDQPAGIDDMLAPSTRDRG